MGPLAFLATPGVGTAIGAGLSGLFGWLGSRGQSKAARSAAQIQADASRQAGQWQQESVREQLEFQREESKRLADEFERAQEANWGMERARQRGQYDLAGDTAANAFALHRQQGRMGYGESAADRFNTRAELLANTKREYGRYAPQQRRIGRLGALMGAPQPPGGREIPSIELPGALQQPEWVPLPAPRQTAFVYPEFQGKTGRTA